MRYIVVAGQQRDIEMRYKQTALLFILIATMTAASADPLGTGFTYQGELQFSGGPANGDFDFQFELFDALSGGVLIDSELVDNATVIDGVFSIELDFGTAPFAGDQLWLEIGVREGISTGGYTGLLPRQKLTAAPYALHAEMVAANAIASPEIANNSVAAVDIAPNAINASKLASNSVGTAAIQNNAVTAAKLDVSCVARSSPSMALSGFFTSVLMSCEAGETLVSGGWNRVSWSASRQCIPNASAPDALAPDTWEVRWAAGDGGTACDGLSQRTIVTCCRF